MIPFIDLAAQYAQLKNRIQSRMQAVLDHGQYLLGPEVTELETELARRAGVKHCITVANGTDALLISLMALGIRPGDEVITTPFTFIASAEMVALLGAVPVFVDIDPDTYNINPALIESAITPRTRCILPVGLYGQCPRMEEINEIAKRHGLPVVEDAAQSFGATRHERPSCGLSTIGCTSFFPTKPLGCYGDGGACFTNEETLATAMRQIRVHGQDRRYHHRVLGLNSRLDTLQAAVLLAKLEVFSEEVTARMQIGMRYTMLLQDHVKTMQVDPGNTCVYAQFTIEVDHREAVAAALKSAGIPSAIHYPMPLYKQTAFAEHPQHTSHLANAERAASRVLSLPMHPWLEAPVQEQIVGELLSVLADCRESLPV